MVGIVLALSSAVVMQFSARSAHAGLFVFHQTSTTVTDLVVSSSITINGSLSDLPTISCNGTCTENPIDFGNLVGLSLSQNAFQRQFSLGDFFAPTNPSEFPYPMWYISPTAIDIIDVSDSDQFDIAGLGANSTIYVASDETGNPNCGESGRCHVTGYWALVSESSSAILLMTSLGGFFMLWFRKNHVARVRLDR